MEEGEDTQSFLNRPLPNLNVNSSSNVTLPDGLENALDVSVTRTVAAPAGFPSKFSEAEKSVVGRVTAWMRFCSA